MMYISAEKYIIEGILKEDYRILKKIYLNYYPGFLRYILSNSGNEEDAKDLFQDALVVIYMKARKNPFLLTSSFKTMLFSICRVLWMKMNSQKGRSYVDLEHRITDRVDEQEDLLGDLIAMERRKLVLKHFKTLNDECRQILKLAIDGTSLELIKNIMGYSSVQYTKNRKYNCKNILIRKVRSSPEFKELKHETVRENTEIPRW